MPRATFDSIPVVSKHVDRFIELSAFVQTVDRGSQAAAARELDVTPAMVGRYVRALEDRLGARLLNRTTATQSLTEAGAAFYARASAVLEQLDEAEHAASDPQAEPRGLLRISAPMVFGVRYLAEAVAAFCNRHPAVRIDLTLDDRVVGLVEEGHDVAVRIGRLVDSSLIARRLATCRMAACASPGYLARNGGMPATPAALGRLNGLLYTYASIRGGTWTFHGPHGEEQIRLGGTLSANNGDALLAAAIAGQGVIVQPTFIVGDALREGRLVRLLPDYRLADLDVHAVYPSARHLSPKVRSLVDFLVAHLATTLEPALPDLQDPARP